MPKRPPSLVCDVCGSPHVLAVAPGSEPVIEFGILLSRGMPQRAWCRGCWPSAPEREGRACVPHVMAPSSRRVPWRVHALQVDTGRAVCSAVSFRGWRAATGDVDCPACLRRLPSYLTTHPRSEARA